MTTNDTKTVVYTDEEATVTAEQWRDIEAESLRWSTERLRASGSVADAADVFDALSDDYRENDPAEPLKSAYADAEAVYTAWEAANPEAADEAIAIVAARA